MGFIIKRSTYTFKQIIHSQDLQKVESKFFTKFILIPLAWPFTWLSLKFGINGNQATLMRLIFYFIAIFLTVINYNHLGYLFLYLNLIFDYVDGQICRVTNTASYSGKFFDGLQDTICHVLFPVIIAVGIYNKNNEAEIIVWGLFSAFLNLSYLYLIIRYSLFQKILKIDKVSIDNSFLKYIEQRLLIDWYDFKYAIFLVCIILTLELYFVYICCIVNLLFFLLLFTIKILKAHKKFNVHRISKTQKIK